MKPFDRWDVLIGLTALACIGVLLFGCGDVRLPVPPALPHASGLTGPPAPTIVYVHDDPLLPLLAWLSWISVAGMALCVVGAFVSVFRTLALTGLVAFAAVLTFARTLGGVLPWLPWIGFAITILGGAALLIQRYRALAVCAVAQIPAEAAKIMPEVLKPTALEKHFKALVDKVAK